jgi:hypothetical protein
VIVCACAVQHKVLECCRAAACACCALLAGASGTQASTSAITNKQCWRHHQFFYLATAGPQIMINSVQLEVARAARGRASDGPRMHVHVDTWQM